MPNARRLAALKNDFNRRRTDEDRKAYRAANEAARREVDAGRGLHSELMAWLDAWQRQGNRACFPSFAAWRAQHSN